MTRPSGAISRLATVRAALGLVALCLGATLLSGCATTQQPVTCASLPGKIIAPASIGLPTSGATVTAAEQVAASGTGAAAIGAYCKVSADIHPVDAKAPPIKMIVNLPANFNGKGLMFGGGGANGTIPATQGNISAGPVNVPVPLAQGYATFSGDSGHQANKLASQDGSFGVNDEAVQNFSGDALKKTRDVAMALIRAFYGIENPRRLYFVGGSTGGREALAVAQQWPTDFDGVVSLYPAWNAATLNLQFGRITRALAAPGAYPNQAKRRALYDAAMQSCDLLDGVADGLISNVLACNAQFDPASATLNGRPLRCPGGADTGDQCLSDAQIRALKTMETSLKLDYAVQSGETLYPGFNVWGADLGMAGTNPLQSRVTFLALNTAQPASPMPEGAPYGSIFWDQWVRFFVTRDPAFNSLSLDPAKPGRWQERISVLTGLQDINKTDLSIFEARGGKLLMAHGMADVLVSTRATEQYFGRLQSTMGRERVQRFARYYEIPGYGHAVSTVFNAAWDSLATLDAWVEKGEAPTAQVVADSIGVPGRTRPLCEHPTWPRYRGTGDVNNASSFICVMQ
ncbi:MAG: tannase/feruloyl esterase family alpha/beta hydrolase [Burkholderiales bacterium]